MSLSAALLAESYRDPHAIYIALRTDGQQGRGTIDDPYDGGTRLGAPMRVTLICNRREFVIGIGVPHGLVAGNPVTIKDVKGAGAASFNISGTVLEVVSPKHFTLLATTVPSAPPAGPFNFTGYIHATIPGFPPDVVVTLYWPVAKVVTGQPHSLAT